MLISRLVRLINPRMCIDCRFCSREVVMQDGLRIEYQACKRGDCDNWQEDKNAPKVQFIEKPRTY